MQRKNGKRIAPCEKKCLEFSEYMLEIQGPKEEIKWIKEKLKGLKC